MQIWYIRFESDVVDIIKTYAAIHKQLDENGEYLNKTETVQDLIRELEKENKQLKRQIENPEKTQPPVANSPQKQEPKSNDIICRVSGVELSTELCEQCRKNPKVIPNCPLKKAGYA
jgi:Arc/MetJ-type ribon-helix-helix transcriptional regulator